MPLRRSLTLAAAVILAALVVHGPTVRFEFVLDDRPLIVHNRFVRQDWSALRAFGHHFFHGGGGGEGYYRPLVVASFALNGRAAGWSAVGFHAVNVLLHAANAALLFHLARRRGARPGIAALAAAVFAAHPATSWPVASIAARVDLMAGTFLLLAWLALERARRDPGTGGVRAAARRGAPGLLFLGGLLCKESAVAFLAPLLLEPAAPEPPPAGAPGPPPAGTPAPRAAGDPAPIPAPSRMRRLLARAGPALAGGAALLAYTAMRRAAGMGATLPLDRIDPQTNPLAFLPWGERVVAALRVTGRHLAYLPAPLGFSDARGYGPGEPPVSPADPWVAGTAAGLLACAAVVIALRLRRHPAAAPLGFALAAFLPASNLLVPIASLYSVNYLYLPLLGGCLALAAVLERAPAAARRAAGWGRIAAATALVAALGTATVIAARPWRDDEELMRFWSTRFPRHAVGHAGLGAVLLDQGRDAEAIPSLRRALDLDGRGAAAHYNLGLALARSARDGASLEEALRHTEIAIAGAYDLVPAYVNAGKILLGLERFAAAEIASREAIRIAPGYPPARMNLAAALFRQGRHLEAASEFADLARDLPRDVSVRSHLVTSLLMADTLDEARREAFRARSAFPDSGRIDLLLARIEARSGRRGEALLYLRSAVTKDPSVRGLIAREDDFAPLRASPAYEEIIAVPGR